MEKISLAVVFDLLVLLSLVIILIFKVWKKRNTVRVLKKTLAERFEKEPIPVEYLSGGQFYLAEKCGENIVHFILRDRKGSLVGKFIRVSLPRRMYEHESLKVGGIYSIHFEPLDCRVEFNSGVLRDDEPSIAVKSELKLNDEEYDDFPLILKAVRQLTN